MLNFLNKGVTLKLKMLQVDEETHKIAKMNAVRDGLSIKAYLLQLVKKDS